MNDLISRRAAIEALNRHLDTIPVVNNNTMEMIRRSEVMDCREIINGLPSEQPEIIRCNDCKWCEDADGLMCKNPASWVVATDYDFGCVYAERRQDG